MAGRYFLDVENSHLGQKWISRIASPEIATTISQKLDIPEILARVIAGRNIEFDAIDDYLRPTLRAVMPDPYILQDMDVAVSRIAKAIENNETIGILGDYDVDGATSTALFLNYFKALNQLSKGKKTYQNPVYYIPDRQNEGYGPSNQAMDWLKQQNCSLVITVDCGVMSFEPIEYANGLGIDVIVLDHHMADELLPNATAIVNPNRQDDISNLGHLAACGVVFVTLVALNRILREEYNFDHAILPNLMAMLDLVALGTVCDVVSLTGLNRAFVSQGLKMMGAGKNIGINAIIDVAQISGKIEAYHLGYVIGPRINAGGRVGNSKLGSLLLSTDDDTEALNIAVKLNEYNIQRQNIEQNVLDAAFYQAELEISADLPKVIIVADKNWHQGVIGIVAGRIKDKYNRPCIVIGFDGVEGKGSGRSIYGVDLGGAIKKAVEAGHLIKGGGHAMAGGLSIHEGQLAGFRAFMAQTLADDVTEAQKNISLKIDGALTASAANIGLIRLLEQLEPFGTGNSKPVFVFPSHHIGFAKIVGKGHLKLSLRSADGSKLDAIAFGAEQNGMANLLSKHNGKAFHFAGNLSVNRWQGRENVQLQIKDIALISY